MGTIPLEEDTKIQCQDGSKVVISSYTTTDDLSRDDGDVGVDGSQNSREFSFSVPLSVYNEKWFKRLCGAIKAYPEFLDSLFHITEIDDKFVIPSSANNAISGDIEHLINLGSHAKFKDFASLRSGRDQFSAMKLPALELQHGDALVTEAKNKLSHLPEAEREVELAKTLRWISRGLTVQLAVKKVNIDREIATNARR